MGVLLARRNHHLETVDFHESLGLSQKMGEAFFSALCADIMRENSHNFMQRIDLLCVYYSPMKLRQTALS